MYYNVTVEVQKKLELLNKHKAAVNLFKTCEYKALLYGFETKAVLIQVYIYHL